MKFHIYIKPHPRLGHSKFLEKYCEDVLPAYIPFEFYDTELFDAICVVYSTITNHSNGTSRTPILSLINLFKSDNVEMKDYPNLGKGDNYSYVNSMHELEKILKLDIN